MNWQRLFRHLFMPPWRVRQVFPSHALHAIAEAVSQSEKTHEGQIRFAVEAALELPALLRGQSARERAVEVFSQLRVWDTERNNGVLVYLLLADHDIEIVADRGIAARVAPEVWEQVAQTMEAAFRNGRFEQGALAGIARISDVLAGHFPPTGRNPDDLANRPVIVRR